MSKQKQTEGHQDKRHRLIVARACQVFGVGRTVEQAVKACKKQGGLKGRKDYKLDVFAGDSPDIQPEIEVTNAGALEWKTAHIIHIDLGTSKL